MKKKWVNAPTNMVQVLNAKFPTMCISNTMTTNYNHTFEIKDVGKGAKMVTKFRCSRCKDIEGVVKCPV